MPNKKDYQEIIEEMSIASDELFSSAFNNRPDRAVFLVREALNYLGYKNYKVISSKTQEKNIHFMKHDTIPDVLVELDTGQQVIVEVQLNNPDLFPPERARYIFASTDVTSLNKGEAYTNLPEQIQLIISKKDLIETGLPIASVRRVIQETGEIFPDKQTILYMNWESRTEADTPINRFLEDFFEKDYTKVHDPVAREILETYKEKTEGKMYLEGKLKALVEKETAEKTAEMQKRILELEQALVEKETAGIQKENTDMQRRILELEQENLQLKQENQKLRKNGF